MQTLLDVGVASEVTNVPRAHVVAISHDAEFGLVEYVPLEQRPHTRSTVPEPGLKMYVPSLQSVHCVQTGLFSDVLYVPASQLPHCRNVVGVGAAVTLVPGAQVPSCAQILFDDGVGATSSTSSVAQVVIGKQPFTFLPG